MLQILQSGRPTPTSFGKEQSPFSMEQSRSSKSQEQAFSQKSLNGSPRRAAMRGDSGKALKGRTSRTRIEPRHGERRRHHAQRSEKRAREVCRPAAAPAESDP